jgi:hypothetical protein
LAVTTITRVNVPVVKICAPAKSGCSNFVTLGILAENSHAMPGLPPATAIIVYNIFYVFVVIMLSWRINYSILFYSWRAIFAWQCNIRIDLF